MTKKLTVHGLNGISEPVAAVCRSRLLSAVTSLIEESDAEIVEVTITNKPLEAKQHHHKSTDKNRRDNDLTPEERAARYAATTPLFDFDQLVISDTVKSDLLLAVDLIKLEKKIFDDWGLRKIEPFPRTALNFHGNPGTGKTLAAHAVASKIKRPILVASYAQIESMYHGEGPKNVEAIFMAAERDAAVLFIDEADSLLSRRLTNVTQGSEQAINSMRSQLLICLERFKGVVIFSTNLVKNYDKAFETRVRHVHFPLPDKNSRKEIWKRHFPIELPLGTDVCLERLSDIDDVCGRDIKNAVLDAAMRAARMNSHVVDLNMFIDSVVRIKSARISHDGYSNSNLTEKEQAEIKEKVKEHIWRRSKKCRSDFYGCGKRCCCVIHR